MKPSNPHSPSPQNEGSEHPVAEPQWMSLKEDDVIKRIRKEKNQAVLAYVATHAHTQWARSEAASMLTDQSLLLDVIKSDVSYGVRGEAIKKLTSQSVLYDIAKNDSSPTIQQYAVRCLTDTSFLKDIITYSENPFVRIEVLERLNDQSVFADIARYDDDDDVRARAVSKLANLSVLTEIAQNDPAASVRRIAVGKLDSPDTLVDVARNDRRPLVRCIALGKIYKTKYLEKKEIHEIIASILEVSETSEDTLVSTLLQLADFLSQDDLETFNITIWRGEMYIVDPREPYFPRKIYYKGRLVRKIDC